MHEEMESKADSSSGEAGKQVAAAHALLKILSGDSPPLPQPDSGCANATIGRVLILLQTQTTQSV